MRLTFGSRNRSGHRQVTASAERESDMQRIFSGLLVLVFAGLVVVAAASFSRINHLEEQLGALTARVDEMQTTRATPAY